MLGNLIPIKVFLNFLIPFIKNSLFPLANIRLFIDFLVFF